MADADETNCIALGRGANCTVSNQLALGSSQYPINQIRFDNGDATIHFNTTGRTLKVNGSLNVTAGNDICIDGGDCLSDITGSSSAGGWTNNSYQTRTALNVNLSAGNLTLEGSGQHVFLPLEDDPTTPTLSFGDSDTGMYGFADNVIRVSVAGTAEAAFTSGAFQGVSNGPAMYWEVPSATNPTLLPSAGDPDTGIGQNAADNISLITGGAEAVRINSEQNIEFMTGNLTFGNTQAFIFMGTERFIHSYDNGSSFPNTFVGKGAGSLTIDGSSLGANTGIGNNVLSSLTDGEYNTMVGHLVGEDLTTGTGNTGIGNSAFLQAISITNSVALGSNALFTVETGTANTALGYHALQYFDGKNSNTFVGSQAGQTHNGSRNTVVGSLSMYLSYDANDNVAVGQQAMQHLKYGDDNVAVGQDALNENNNGSGNTVLGHSAGYGVAGNNYDGNIFVGFQAGNSVTTGDYNIIIGYDEDLPTTTTSNHLNIGGTIFGDLSSGQVGIGTASPNNTLTVIGTINASGNVYDNGNRVCTAANGLCGGASSGGGWTNTSTWTSTDLNVNVTTGNMTIAGDLGIGIEAPAGKLHIYGGLSGQGQLVVASNASDEQVNIALLKDATREWALYIPAADSTLRFYNEDLDEDVMTITNQTRVGIGTTEPNSTLHVVGTINASGNVYDNYERVCTASNGLCGSSSSAGGWTNTSTTTYTGLTVNITSDDSNNMLNLRNSSGTVLTYVGPDGNLVISGDNAGTDLIHVDGVASQTADYLQIQDSGGGNVFTIGATERVSIGDGAGSSADLNIGGARAIYFDGGAATVRSSAGSLSLQGSDSTSEILLIGSEIRVGGDVGAKFNIIGDTTIGSTILGLQQGNASQTYIAFVNSTGSQMYNLNERGLGIVTSDNGIFNHTISTDVASQAHGDGVGLDFVFQRINGVETRYGNIYVAGDNISTDDSSMHFSIVDGGTMEEHMEINGSGVYVAGSHVCTASNGLCDGGSSGGGWTNNSQNTSTTLNVGIGTSNPVNELEVTGSTSNNVLMRVTNTNTLGESGIVLGETIDTSTPFYIQRYGSTDASRPNDVEFVAAGSGADIILDPTDYVGINTVDPNNTLHVVGDINATNGVCDDASGYCLSDISGLGGGNVSGTGGANTRVAYWTSASDITGNAGFTFDGDNLTLPGGIITPTDIAIGPSGTHADDPGTVAIGWNANGTGTNAVVIGRDTRVVNAGGSVAVGYLADVSSASTGTALGRDTSVTANFGTAVGSYSTAVGTAVALGYSVNASGTGTVAIGDGTNASGTNSIAIGTGTWANDTEGVAIGDGAVASEQYTVAVGPNSLASGGASSVALGASSRATGSSSVALGQWANSTGTSVSVGANTHAASGDVALGYEADARDDSGFSIAIGYQADSATAGGGIAIGYLAQGAARGIAIGEEVTGDQYGVTLGQQATGNTGYGVTIGAQATGSNYGVAIGNLAYAGALSSIALGVTSNASNQRAMALGEDTRATADYAVALGYAANASAAYAVALGYQAEASVANQFMVGSSAQNLNTYIYGDINVTSSNDICIDGGNCLSAAGSGNITGTAGAADRVAYWDGSGSITGNSGFTFDGENLTLPGHINMPSLFYIGSGATVTGSNSVAIGSISSATGSQSIALGYRASTANNYAVAIGYNASVEIQDAIAIGQQSRVYSEGSGGIAIGRDAVVNRTTGISIGMSSESRDFYAIALGDRATAMEQRSVAIGLQSNASHLGSVAIGAEATTTKDNQLMIGSSGYNLNTYIYGNLNASGKILVGSALGEESSAVTISGDGGLDRLHVGTVDRMIVGEQDPVGSTSGRMISSSGGILFRAAESGAYDFVIQNDSTAGFGTTDPNVTLHVVGRINATSDVCDEGSGKCLSTTATDEVGTLVSGRACYTVGSDVDCDDVFYWDAGQNQLGVGLNPSYNFHMNGTANISGVYINSTGAVGIGTANPTKLLELAANDVRLLFNDTSGVGNPNTTWQITINDADGGTANKFAIDDLTNGVTPLIIENNTPSNTLYLDNSGYVGIGNSNPAAPLDFASSGYPLDLVNFGSPTRGIGVSADGGLIIWGNSSSTSSLVLKMDSRTGGNLFKVNSSGITVAGINFTADTDTFHIDSTNDRVGIGTTNPVSDLHIYTANAQHNDYGLLLQIPTSGIDGYYTGIYFKGDTDTNDARKKGAILFERQASYGRGKMHFALEGSADETNANATDSVMTLNYDGKVGIGTISPHDELTVTNPAGSAPVIEINLNDSSIGASHEIGSIEFTGDHGGSGLVGAKIVAHAAGTWGQVANDEPTEIQFWTSEGSGNTVTQRMVLSQYGDLGIGTDSPTVLIHVNETTESTTGIVGRFESNASSITGIYIENTDATGREYGLMTTTDNHVYDAGFMIYDETGSARRIFINATGAISMGNVDPAAHLHVGTGSPENATGMGDIYATDDIEYDGNLYGSGADVAEITPASETGLQPGTVLELDPNVPGSVRRSSGAYSRLVAGIVSTDPSIILASDEQGVKMAITGRVPVKANNENGPIAIGDLLTTSSTPGEAMRCSEHSLCFGSIVGKAMESLQGEAGTVTALVTLS